VVIPCRLENELQVLHLCFGNHQLLSQSPIADKYLKSPEKSQSEDVVQIKLRLYTSVVRR